MFKFLLATRYLRTRYIALASIVSVMLGVATMIVVNSVMSGFREEMYNRLHGILSDVVVASHGLDGIKDSEVTTHKNSGSAGRRPRWSYHDRPRARRTQLSSLRPVGDAASQSDRHRRRQLRQCQRLFEVPASPGKQKTTLIQSSRRRV